MNTQSIKTMLLGILLMLFGGFLMADPSSSLGGIEAAILFAGLLVGIYGFIRNN